MSKSDYHIVISWTGADKYDCAAYMVAIYADDYDGAPVDFVTIDDADSGTDAVGICDADREKIEAAISDYVAEYNLDRVSLPITYDI